MTVTPRQALTTTMVHILNYYDTYNKSFALADKGINAVGTFYGATTFYALTDAAWAKYRLGEFLETKDPAGAPATANPWARGLDPATVYQNLKPGILPGVILVPGLVVAIEQAQRAGLTYHRQ